MAEDGSLMIIKCYFKTFYKKLTCRHIAIGIAKVRERGFDSGVNQRSTMRE